MPERNLFATPRDLEGAARGAGKFLESLRQSLGRKETYLAQLTAVEGYVKMQGISPAALTPLKARASQGVTFVRFTPEALQEAFQIAGQLAPATWEKMRSGDNSPGWLGWKSKGRGQAEAVVLRWYESAVQADATVALVFELGCRDLFRKALPRAATGAMATQREVLEPEYFSEACALIKACRNRLRTKYALEVSLEEKVLDHPAWLSNLTLARLPDKELTFERFGGAATREYNLTPGLAGRLYRVLYGDWVASQEKALFDALGKTTGKPEEILNVLAGKLSSLGERTVQEVQKALARRAKELESGYTRELEELRAYEGRVKKDIQGLVTQLTDGLKDLPRGISPDNLPGVKAQMMGSLLTSEGALSEQVGLLRDLGRKMKAAESSLGQAKSLGKMSLEEVAALLLGERGKAALLVDEHLQRFYELREALSGEYSQIWEQKSKELAAALKEEIGNNQAAVKEAKRALEKGGKGDSDRRALEERVRTWESELAVLSEMESTRGLSKAYAVEQVITGYVQFMQNVVEPFVIARALELMVCCSLPPTQEMPPHEKRQALDEKVYLAIACEAEGGLFTLGGTPEAVRPVPPDEALRQRKELSGIIQRRCGRAVTVLAYSCRGMDYLTSRLGGAEARKIRNRFTSAMAGASRRAGAFLLKETEEGGVNWFGESSREVYDQCYNETSAGEGMKLRHSLTAGKEAELAADDESGRNAIVCATEMLSLSEQFIREHFALFKEWFKDTPEWKGLPQGVPYNALPIELKRLFRVGIGLASGLPGKDIAFGPNALGDPDLSGVALTDAVLLSRLQGVDAEESIKSTILAEENTVLNLSLSLDRFSLEEEGKTFLAEAVGAKIRRIGYCLFSPSGGGARVLLTEKDETLELDPLGGLKARGGERTKLLYQVLPLELTQKTQRKGG